MNKAANKIGTEHFGPEQPLAMWDQAINEIERRSSGKFIRIDVCHLLVPVIAFGSVQITPA